MPTIVRFAAWRDEMFTHKIAVGTITLSLLAVACAPAPTPAPTAVPPTAAIPGQIIYEKEKEQLQHIVGDSDFNRLSDLIRSAPDNSKCLAIVYGWLMSGKIFSSPSASRRCGNNLSEITSIASQYVPSAVTATNSPTPFALPTGTANSTPVLPTATRSPTPLPLTLTPLPPAPGVYVTKIRIEPPNPNIVEDIRFFVTFWNTAGPLQFKWCVYIFNAGAQNPRGQTSCNSLMDFPLGTYEYSTPNTWKLGPGAPCTDLIARVQGIETNGNHLIFKTPDFSENSFSFRVCP